jgi:hypothetical protein
MPDRKIIPNEMESIVRAAMRRIVVSCVSMISLLGVKEK